MIYNVVPGTFNKYGIRFGDLVAVVNFIQWFRQDRGRPDIKLHIRPNVLVPQGHVHTFFKFLCETTDCFSEEEGIINLPYHELMLWDFRDIIGDHVSLPNNRTPQKKVVVFPIYDAEYHTHRNWSLKLLDSILAEMADTYPTHERIICVKDLPEISFNTYGFTFSTDFLTNIYHIMEAEVFVGGDTGSSHLASAVNPGPKRLIYYYNGRGMIHTLPFHVLQGKGELRKFWVNCEGTTHNGKLII
jgi:hypothetical protein